MTPHYLTRASTCIKISCDGQFYAGDHDHEDIGDEGWKLDLGDECNTLLNLADELQDKLEYPAADMPIKGDGKTIVAALRSIVFRVAEFEELETEP